MRAKKKIMTAVMAVFFLFLTFTEDRIKAETQAQISEIQEPEDLYALSAVLMDAESGRVLYDKEGEIPRPNASTTKVLTCILAIENAPGDDYVLVSKRAEIQPEVKLGLKEGEQYYLEDLLYSLMLKSHNDTAVAIAEHIGGTVEKFADMMNEKAKKIGCRDTYFITPNGLDEEDEKGIHHTTAKDLALIMCYAIRNQTFLSITRTMDYSFSDIKGERHFSFHNANAFLEMTDGVISGKTGFTGNAGYCYVCACDKKGKRFVVALLGCGWPDHKTYKWKDSLKLLEYGEENYEYRTLYKEIKMPEIPVRGGARKYTEIGNPVIEKLYLDPKEREKTEQILLRKDEQIFYRQEIPEELEAPVAKDEEIGNVSVYIGDQKWRIYPVKAVRRIEKNSLDWCISVIFHEFFH